MSNELFEQWMNFSKDAAEPMMKLNELSAQTMEKVARQQLDMAKDYMELGTQQLQLIGKAQNPQEWASVQSELVSQFSQKLMTRAEAFMQLASEAQKNLADWSADVTNRVKNPTK